MWFAMKWVLWLYSDNQKPMVDKDRLQLQYGITIALFGPVDRKHTKLHPICPQVTVEHYAFL